MCGVAPCVSVSVLVCHCILPLNSIRLSFAVLICLPSHPSVDPSFQHSSLGSPSVHSPGDLSLCCCVLCVCTCPSDRLPVCLSVSHITLTLKLLFHLVSFFASLLTLMPLPLCNHLVFPPPTSSQQLITSQSTHRLGFWIYSSVERSLSCCLPQNGSVICSQSTCSLGV